MSLRDLKAILSRRPRIKMTGSRKNESAEPRGIVNWPANCACWCVAGNLFEYYMKHCSLVNLKSQLRIIISTRWTAWPAIVEWYYKRQINGNYLHHLKCATSTKSSGIINGSWMVPQTTEQPELSAPFEIYYKRQINRNYLCHLKCATSSNWKGIWSSALSCINLPKNRTISFE